MKNKSMLESAIYHIWTLTSSFFFCEMYFNAVKINASRNSVQCRTVSIIIKMKHELKQLLSQYEHLFIDIATSTEDCESIKQRPYILNQVKRSYSVWKMKLNIQTDQSNYSSPCRLVPKSNEINIMCKDYKKLNAVTKSDLFLYQEINIPKSQR